jgi:hypothetical protein
MESLPRVAAAMQHVLTEVAERAAREAGFVRRRRVVTGPLFVQALVLGWLARPEATLHQLAQALAVLGAPISPQGVARRFGPEAADLLGRVSGAAVGALTAPRGTGVPLPARFAGVYVLDCTTVRLPDALAAVWPGCGGRTGRGTQAALKLQVRLDLAGGGLEGPVRLTGRTQDTAGPLHAAPLPVGALLLADLGSWSLGRFRGLGEAGSFWLSRLDPRTVVLDPAGRRLDLPSWLNRRGAVTVEAPVLLGSAARLPARLLAARAPQAVADERRRKLRAAANREGKAPPQATLALAGWTVAVTNAPAERLTLAEAFVVGRARWQVELLFKLWKRDGHLAVNRSADPWRVLCEVSAKLVALLIQHWILLIGCWAIRDRSLVRAAQTVRGHAACLLAALGQRDRLVTELRVIARCLGAGCRVAPRRATPSAFQLWLDPALAGLS